MIHKGAPVLINASFTGLKLGGIYTTREVVAVPTGLPVGGTAESQTRTMARIVVPVDAGDVLELTGRMRVTNNIGPVAYTVGIDYWWDVYDVDDGLDSGDPNKVWTRVSPSNGENVDRNVVHHLPLTLVADVYQIPPDWPAGHRIVVVFRADASSTGWDRNSGNDRITVDDQGVITVRRWVPDTAQ